MGMLMKRNWHNQNLNDSFETKMKILHKIESTVGKHTPCGLSFVYTSYIRYGVRAGPKFGKHASLFSYYKRKKYVKAVICSVMLWSFSNVSLLEIIC